MKTCPGCGSVFETKYEQKIYCSNPCRIAHWRMGNIKQRQVVAKAYYLKNREKILSHHKRRKQFSIINRLRAHISSILYQRKQIKTAGPAYVRSLLRRNTQLAGADIPDGMIELHAQTLKLKRTIWKRPNNERGITGPRLNQQRTTNVQGNAWDGVTGDEGTETWRYWDWTCQHHLQSGRQNKCFGEDRTHGD